MTIGKFDGVHAGHRAVIERVLEVADADGSASVVLTFDRNPLALLRPELCPEALVSVGQKLELLAETGVDATLVLPFDADFAAQTPEQFVRGHHACDTAADHGHLGAVRLGGNPPKAAGVSEPIVVGEREIRSEHGQRRGNCPVLRAFGMEGCHDRLVPFREPEIRLPSTIRKWPEMETWTSCPRVKIFEREAIRKPLDTPNSVMRGACYSATLVRPHQVNTGTLAPSLLVVNSPPWAKCS